LETILNIDTNERAKFTILIHVKSLVIFLKLHAEKLDKETLQKA